MGSVLADKHRGQLMAGMCVHVCAYVCVHTRTVYIRG